jgi:TPR repeat protein
MLLLRAAQPEAEAARASLAAAAAQGFLPASYELAVLARDAGDLAGALALLRLAAEEGLPEAECELGVFHSKGWVCEQDYERALELLVRAAAQGSSCGCWLYCIFTNAGRASGA